MLFISVFIKLNRSRSERRNLYVHLEKGMFRYYVFLHISDVLVSTLYKYMLKVIDVLWICVK